ncbi:isocitrate lyase/phosphoenolpyruvate mutase family protein [Streptomyces sp. NRRL F-5727]|uniref:isocitrate lyase/phosphoenolpyruvate mutase family protein n=1 Tax=Streptomyces sp. NRRL F-5727 TaxID=1463871 RepID=UPI0004CC4D17|nr:isocitrate lyase/phosphoenolpyruvate mutase family protein [Streptomyces sp. NRRL F-5727]
MADGTKAVHLRKALAGSERKHPLLAIGAVNALAAHVAAESGFDALWVSGLEVSAASGLPDANVLGPRDLSDVVASLGRVTELPVIVDIDNAGGSGRTAERFAYDLMRAGAAAVCVEDSAYPKCNSFAAHRAQNLADQDLLCEQVGRIRKVAGDGLMVVARTEALIVGEDIATAIARAEAYAEAGADAILIHSKDATGEQARAIGRAWRHGVPLVSVPTAFPDLSAAELGEAGFSLCIYANQLSRAALAGMRAAARQFRRGGSFRSTVAGSLAEVGDLMRVGEPEALSCL